MGFMVGFFAIYGFYHKTLELSSHLWDVGYPLYEGKSGIMTRLGESREER